MVCSVDAWQLSSPQNIWYIMANFLYYCCCCWYYFSFACFSFHAVCTCLQKSLPPSKSLQLCFFLDRQFFDTRLYTTICVKITSLDIVSLVKVSNRKIRCECIRGPRLWESSRYSNHPGKLLNIVLTPCFFLSYHFCHVPIRKMFMKFRPSLVWFVPERGCSLSD